MQVWKLFPVVAAAVESMQPGAQAAAASFIAASVWGRKAEQPPAATVEAEQAMLQQASIEGAAAASPAGNGKESGTGSNSSKSSLTAMEALGSGGARQLGTASLKGGSNDIAGLAILRPSAALEAQPRSAVRRVLARAGLGAPNFLPALHMGVLFAAAGSLTVVKAAYLGLGQRADWVAFTGGWRGGGWVAPGAWKPLDCLHATASCTSSACCTPPGRCRLLTLDGAPMLVSGHRTTLCALLNAPFSAVCAAFEKSQGRTVHKCINRLLGTVGGAAYSCLVIGLIYAFNGGSYDNTVVKSVSWLPGCLWCCAALRCLTPWGTFAGCLLCPLPVPHLPSAAETSRRRCCWPSTAASSAPTRAAIPSLLTHGRC